jgi:hypothetical protein
MNDKPDWVPDWVWSGYLAFLADFKFHKWIEIGRTIVFDKSCADVWLMMERRAGDFSKYHAARSIEMRVECPDMPESESTYTNAEKQLLGVLAAACFAREGANPHERIPASERTSRGNRIARLTADLRAELDATRRGPYGWLPEVIARSIRDAADATVANSPLVEELEVRAGRGDDGLNGSKYRNVSAHVAHFVTDHDYPALSAIERGAANWSRSMPVLYRPNTDGSNRQYFIVMMTDHFRRFYGTPLRDATASLTRALFNDDTDAATVAKLAP